MKRKAKWGGRRPADKEKLRESVGQEGKPGLNQNSAGAARETANDTWLRLIYFIALQNLTCKLFAVHLTRARKTRYGNFKALKEPKVMGNIFEPWQVHEGAAPIISQISQ